jgi:uncharacterized protein
LSSVTTPTTNLLDAIRGFAVARCDPSDPAHDELHLQRVVANARLLAAEEAADVDMFVVEAAGWLHDCVQLPKGQGEPGEAAKRSAQRAAAHLLECGVEPPIVEGICAAIRTHSFSGGLRPESLEAAILQDADRLDALGAVGIARFWATMVRMGGLMYHPTDPSALTRELDDRAWALDHLQRKLFKLVDLMNTQAGRAEAERRTAFLHAYRAEFLREVGAAEAT